MKLIIGILISIFTVVGSAKAGNLNNNADNVDYVIVKTSRGSVGLRNCSGVNFGKCDYYDQNGCAYQIVRSERNIRRCELLERDTDVEFNRNYSTSASNLPTERERFMAQNDHSVLVTTKLYRCVRAFGGKVTMVVSCDRRGFDNYFDEQSSY